MIAISEFWYCRAFLEKIRTPGEIKCELKVGVFSEALLPLDNLAVAQCYLF